MSNKPDLNNNVNEPNELKIKEEETNKKLQPVQNYEGPKESNNEVLLEKQLSRLKIESLPTDSELKLNQKSTGISDKEKELKSKDKDKVIKVVISSKIKLEADINKNDLCKSKSKIKKNKEKQNKIKSDKEINKLKETEGEKYNHSFIKDFQEQNNFSQKLIFEQKGQNISTKPENLSNISILIKREEEEDKKNFLMEINIEMMLGKIALKKMGIIALKKMGTKILKKRNLIIQKIISWITI